MIRPVFTGKENMTQIVSIEKLTDSITAIEIEAPEIAAAALTGQVVMTRLGDQAEAHPRAIADFDTDKGTITIVIRNPAADSDALRDPVSSFTASGDTAAPAEDTSSVTTQELDENSVVHIDGTVEQAGNMPVPGKALLVAEGLGVPAVFTRLRELKEKGCYTMLIAGYPSKNEIFWLDRLDKYCDELYVITEDGSYGIKGPVRQTLKAVCDQIQEIEHVYAAGPIKFLKSASDTTRPFSIPTTISLAAVFDAPDVAPAQPDGSEGTREAPDLSGQINLDGHQVDFDELMKKLGFQTKK